ncbi:MAG: M13 family metallopeptidase [Myxococcales bacterium]|nr:M13 family metallopeptidase [Myxococcales bacterium]
MTHSRLVPLFFALAGATGAACSGPTPRPATPLPDPGPTPPAPDPATPPPDGSTTTLAAIGLDPTALDRSVDPCDDFYQYACGGWIARTEIPADKPMAMRSFISIEDRNREFLHDVLERARAAPGADPALATLGSFYGACMDEAAVEAAGVTPLAALDKTIAAVKDGPTLAVATAALHQAGAGALFTFGHTQDAKDARQVIGGIEQGGLGLPDRDYYLKDDEATKGLRAAYAAYLASLLELDGRSPADAATGAAEVIALETALAKVSLDKVARRDPVATYNRLERAGVKKAAPHFAWDTYFAAVGAPRVTAITVGSPAFLRGLDPLVTRTKPAVWRTYLRLHLLSATAALLPKRFDDAQFAFVGALTGQAEQEVRWKRCVAATDGALGELLGQVFVRERFGAAAKQGADQQVRAIADAMRANLDALPWMDATTKAAAATKLDAMAYQIGYPKQWRPVGFTPVAGAYAASELAARKAEHARLLAKIGKPLDRDEWLLSAPTVNAYYEPQLNGMVFPAGILQAPFFDPAAALPVNLGAMGVVVGHELTHGFDDQGAQFDAVGNLANWWAPATGAQFKQRTQCVIAQYDAYEALPGVKLNGANTVGENIADIGGVKLALRAYRALRTGPAQVADGFTEDQQFFLGFGQAWCAKMRPDFAALLATVDVHAPSQWRVNGALQATPEFADAFGCKPGARMRPAAMCQVW